MLFVAGLHMGVAGAGLATVIAEAVSAVLCVIYVYFRVPMLHLKKEHFQLDKLIDMDDSTVRWYVVTSAVQSAAWKAFDSGCNQYAWCWCNGSI